MKTSTWLRIAAVLALGLAIGHSLGRPWTPAKSLEARAVVLAMQSVEFPAAGVARSYFDFYQGFGLAISAFVLALAALCWRQGSAVAAGVPVDPVAIGALLACFLANTVIAAVYLVWLPAAFNAAVVVALAAALVAGRRPAGG